MGCDEFIQPTIKTLELYTLSSELDLDC